MKHLFIETLLYGHPLSSLYYFFKLPTFGIFFDNINLLKNEINTKINSWGNVSSSCLVKQHQMQVWFKIITISGIKTSLRENKHCKWETCRGKGIVATKSMYYKWKAVCTPFHRQPLCMECPLLFLATTFYNFSKIWTFYK